MKREERRGVFSGEEGYSMTYQKGAREGGMGLRNW